jgi:sarcosine oxidase subunit gamma
VSSLAPLKALTALDNFSEEMHGITVSEVTDQAIVSMAIPKATNEAFNKAIKKSFKVERPTIGQFTQSKLNNARFLGLQQDQLFVLFNYTSDRAVEEISEKINAGNQLAYLSDQSDSWMTLRVSGNNCRDALERICPLDIHPTVFPVGSVARTSMEHMAVIILHKKEDSYLLLSLRSFAHSFLHAVTTSIKNIS